VTARAHQTLIWERTRHLLRLRVALREFFPAALDAYKPLGLTSAETLQLLIKAPDPSRAARLRAGRSRLRSSTLAATDAGWHPHGSLTSDTDADREGFAFLCDLDPVFALRFEDESAVAVIVTPPTGIDGLS
jgi:hypothetical protein